ncbi:hypothetical protein ACFW1M_28540 [Streptomyces inhibens]|uniref:hypothetical protein n=1 Tax=Streptomyces inhibens TaxID=2293571 RepID=UPI0036B4571E
MNVLDVIADQVRTTCTGAMWQLNALRALRREIRNRQRALHRPTAALTIWEASRSQRTPAAVR